jgi:anaerobic ribonucleoside-triphosphate reductase activating protein
VLINSIVFSNIDHPKLPGISIFFQGCDAQPKCGNCHNPQTWEFDETYFVPYKFLLERVKKDLSFLLQEYDKVSLNFLGGEPLSKINRGTLKMLSKDIKSMFDKRVTTLLYSWRKPIEIHKQRLLEFVEHIDEFVLGRYLEKYKSLDAFPASKNQLYITYYQLQEIISIIEEKEDEYADINQL